MDIKASTYYLSLEGDDNANGNSPSTAWATIEKVNNFILSPGDSVLFRAGDIWRETLLIQQSGEKDNWIVYSRYGSGKNPEIYGSDLATDWIATGTQNIWVCNTSLVDYSTYAQPPLWLSYPGRMFLIQDDSASWANYCDYEPGFANLEKEFDYTTDVSTNLHYLYSETDPDEAYDAIEVTQRTWCVRMQDGEPENYIEINGINMKYAREEGFFTGYPAEGDPHDLVFKNCSIQYIGLPGSGHAYGLGVWHSNLLIENCLFSDAGRRAISYNFYDVGLLVGQERKRNNIIVRNNIFKRGWHTTSLDLSCSDADGDTVTDVFFYNNIIDDSELIDSVDKVTSSTPSRTSQQFYLNTYGNDNINRVYVYNNLFIHSTARAINIFNDDTVHIWNNTIVGHNQTLLYKNPDGSISSGEGDQMKLDIRNNIIHDNLPDNDYWNAAIHTYMWNVDYYERDYNLYSCLFPENENRLIASLYNGTNQEYYLYSEWDAYKTQTAYDLHSPDPDYAGFTNESEFNFHITEQSPTRNAGTPVFAILTDPFGIKDTLGLYDFEGVVRSDTSPSIGAYEFSEVLPSSLNSKETTNANFVIYPNPSSNQITIQPPVGFSNLYSVQIFDLQGRKIYVSDNIEHFKHIINLDKYPDGLYSVNIISDNKKIMTNKLIIKQ